MITKVVDRDGMRVTVHIEIEDPQGRIVESLAALEGSSALLDEVARGCYVLFRGSLGLIGLLAHSDLDGEDYPDAHVRSLSRILEDASTLYNALRADSIEAIRKAQE